MFSNAGAGTVAAMLGVNVTELVRDAGSIIAYAGTGIAAGFVNSNVDFDACATD